METHGLPGLIIGHRFSHVHHWFPFQKYCWIIYIQPVLDITSNFYYIAGPVFFQISFWLDILPIQSDIIKYRMRISTNNLMTQSLDIHDVISILIKNNALWSDFQRDVLNFKFYAILGRLF